MQEIKLENIIIGRVEPHIYAFTTGTVPNYLKVGDTYRPVSLRLNEWKEHFPDLEKKYEEIAKVNDNVYFRDYAVHQYLENDKSYTRLTKANLPNGVYYSKEFFNNATEQDVAEAIEDINADYKNNNGKYQFYNAETQLPETFTYARTETYKPRPNQQETIDRFNQARAKGRTNLLMYAVMRFGKSFTSMCCAVEMKARIVVIVSAKADVKSEWKKTVESHIKFENYTFIDSNNLHNESAIKEVIKKGKSVAVFLTLQDLQGDEIKEKHKEVFENEIDLLIVDETHFGARAEKYGQVLKELGKAEAKATTNKKDSDDFVEAKDANEQINKVLNAKIKLHLSGTPYRILMSSEFTQDDIIAFYQFSDIVKDLEEWDKDNILSDDVKEWDNPYYGFPQMVRFAFNPNESSRKRLEQLKLKGVSYAFSALLKPKSITLDDENKYKEFLYEKEIIDLLEVIDGSKEEEGLLGFLDYDKIKEGNMCKHIVMVLPYCASCDAMEELIHKNSDKFKNLSKYEIINISGLNVDRALGDTRKIKEYIHKCEKEGIKTLTLTVNRMLTGSTVEEWDTMIYLKDTASPQEYDQAIFRLQNQYIKKYVDDNGNEIKYNMKPQTLLVDFDPNRMFAMQEQKAQIYNVNVDEAGNSKLEERLREELRISPIITMNSDKIERVEASDIIAAVSEYSKNRGVAEETLEIPVDLTLLDIDLIYNTISNENELGSKDGLTIKANQGDDQEIEFDSEVEETQDENDDSTSETINTQVTEYDNEENKHDPVKQFRSYYARILFFAFLTKDIVISLEDVISVIDTQNNARIAKNIGISKNVLECIQANINKFILRDLDYKIYNLNRLSNDSTVEPIERANVAIKKFGRLGVSEIITPQNICDDMVNLIPDDCYINAVNEGNKFLDIAGKAGEFALAIYRKFSSLEYNSDQIKDVIYTIPTSSITYEFTRMVYEILGLNIDNIASKFNTYDLLKPKDRNGNIDYYRINNILKQNKPFKDIIIDHDFVEKGDEIVKFDAIVGNPPYQENIGSKSNRSLSKQLFPAFIQAAILMEPEYISLITPSRWFTANAQDRSFLNLRNFIKENNHFVKIVNFLDNRELFNDVNISGGVNYFLYKKDYIGLVEFTETINKKSNKIDRPLFEKGLDVILPKNDMISILRKVMDHNFSSISNIVTGRNPFGVPANDDDLEKVCVNKKDVNHSIKIRCAYEQIKYISKDEITKRFDLLNSFKVFTSKMNGAAGVLLDDKSVSILGKPYVADDNSVCSNALICIGCFPSEQEAKNLEKYFKTKFFRFMVGIKKMSQVLTSNVYEFAPLQNFNTESDIDWSKSIPEIDQQLYKKYSLSQDEITFIEGKIKPMD